jgi:hypothetical protein
MAETVERTPQQGTAETDVASAVHDVLAASTDPLTVAKILARFSLRLRAAGDQVRQCLQRQVAAGVLYRYPKYRSQQDRYWDRAMPVHIASLLRQGLRDGPLSLSELRRRLPAYAVQPMEDVLREQVAQGLLHRHPRPGRRGGERFGISPPDAKEHLRPALASVFQKLQQLGFTRSHLRYAALELLHDEEWGEQDVSLPATSTQQTASQSTRVLS